MSKSAGPSLIHVPPLFSTVEPGVYRCASPSTSQIPFLASLGLKTILSLTPEHPTKQLLAHVKSASLNFIHLGTILWGPLTDWKPIRDEVVKAALEILLDVRNHPVLLIDPLGVHQTGCVVGALRILQNWNFASILVEYRAHSGPTKHRISDEQYIELFDPDLINLPPLKYRPVWLLMDHDGADTDYSAEDEPDHLDTILEVKGAESETGREDESVQIPGTDAQQLTEMERTITDNGHTGVG